MESIRITAFSVFVLGLAACATQRPALLANAHLTNVGSAAAERDVDDCLVRAEAASTEGRNGESVAAGAASSSVVGAAAGGAGGAVVGDAGRGAAAGAVGGAVASLTSALMQSLFRPRQPDPGYRQFVDRCLREKGYEPAGWK